MAVIISKEDLAGKVATAITPVPTNTLAQVNQVLTTVDMLLKNPIVQRFILRFAGRFGVGNINTPSVESNSNPVLNPQTIYDMILGTVTSIITLKGDIPLSQVKTYLISNKKDVIELISKSFKPKQAEPKKVIITDGTKPKQ